MSLRISMSAFHKIAEGKNPLAALLLSIAILTGCQAPGGPATNSSNQPSNAQTNTSRTNTAAAEPNADGLIPSGTGVEKEKPAAGTGNVQGKAFYNEKPAAGVEVKLCETFSRFVGGCGGEVFTTKTDGNGEYLIKNVPPGIYEGLTVQVFDTKYFVFATSGIVQSAKYKVEDGQTYFAPDTNLFKQDLKLVSPKAGSKLDGTGIEVKWDAYPDTAYYKFSIHADSASGAKTEYDYINKRVDGLSYSLDKPLAPGTYSCKVDAFNANDIKLSQSASDIKFTVTGAAAK